jgi:hypothetical protein
MRFLLCRAANFECKLDVSSRKGNKCCFHQVRACSAVCPPVARCVLTRRKGEANALDLETWGQGHPFGSFDWDYLDIFCARVPHYACKIFRSFSVPPRHFVWLWIQFNTTKWRPMFLWKRFLLCRICGDNLASPQSLAVRVNENISRCRYPISTFVV